MGCCWGSGLIPFITAGVAQAAGGAEPVPSAFDDAVDALAPDVWYKFEDSSFATTLVDSGTEGIDLTSQNTVDASAGAAMRSTKTQSLFMPGCTATNWSTQSAYYTDTSFAMRDFIGGKGDMTIAFSYMMASDVTHGSKWIPMFWLGPNGDTPDDIMVAGLYVIGTDHINVFLRGSAGDEFLQTSGGGHGDDDHIHFFIGRIKNSTTQKWAAIDGAVYGDSSSTTLGTLNTGDFPFSIGGNQGLTLEIETPDWWTDFFGLWDRYLSDAECLDLWEKYNDETAPIATDATIAWDDTATDVPYWVGNGTEFPSGDSTDLLFLDTLSPLNPASAVRMTSRIYNVSSYIPTIDPGAFNANEYVMKYEQVSLVSGAWSNLELNAAASQEGVWTELVNAELILNDPTDDATSQHVIIDITLAATFEALYPIRGTEKTKRVTMFADYGNAKNTWDAFSGTSGTGLQFHSPNTNTAGGGWGIDAGTLEIYIGHAVGSGSGDNRAVIDTGDADSICNAQLYYDSNGGSAQPMGLIARRQDASNYWELIVEDAETSNPVLKLNEVNSGTPTTQDSVTMTGIGPLDDKDSFIQIECEGNEIAGYFAGPQLLTNAVTPDISFEVAYTSSSMNTETHYGIRLTGDGSGGTGSRADDFRAKPP